MNIKGYFENLENLVRLNYEVARAARKKGIDPVAEVEVSLANSLAERVLGLLSILYPQILDKRIVNRILELENQFGSLDPAVALIIAEEVAKEKFCKFKDHLEAIEAGVRIAIGYMTLGYVSSPIEGFIQIKIRKTRDGRDYLAPYYSGPIRSAGGTEAAFSLVVVDYLRELFGYSLYDPSEEEVKRGIHECYEYHERITNLQYLPSEEEIGYLVRHLPVQLTGDASEEKEVYNYKDLPRIETNFLRSGFCLVLGEGLAQKAPKILGRIIRLKQRGFSLSGWDWMADFVALQERIKGIKKSEGGRVGATYMQDLVAGRPVFAHPSQPGAFRLRYGRARTTGYSTLGVHPATMGITDGFIAVGTQLKIEKPTKGCTVASCDSIDGPIVKLIDGSVKYIDDYLEAKKIYSKVAEVIYLGDILVPYGDFFNRSHLLEKAGYVEEYWSEHLKNAGGVAEKNVSFERAVELSKNFGIPLHPKYIFYWGGINYELFLGLLDWIAHSEIREGLLALPYGLHEKERFTKGKRALELIGCPHDVGIADVLVSIEKTKALLFNLGIDLNGKLDAEVDGLMKKVSEKHVLEILQEISTAKILDKAGTFIGARMGRPEKSKLRILAGSPHVLFPVGEEGGRLRSVQEAFDFGSVSAEFGVYYCAKCIKETIYPKCEVCDSLCEKRFYCRDCMRSSSEKCEEHGYSQEFAKKRIDIRHYFENAKKAIGIHPDEINVVVKGVRGTSNKDHSCEHLAKGLLRAKHNLHVNKDGTIRYDMTEMPITHFKPAEIGTGVRKLKEMGYEKDIYGSTLERDNQVLEIFPHDIILPSCPVSSDEKADEVFLSVTKFIDEELSRLYGVAPYFNANKKEDLIGVLMGCLAPHTSCAVVGRIIGFSKVQAFLTSPYIHAAMRRDCDGDEAAVMLLMDLLLNFSRKFLPSHRGGTQDAPLVLNMRIRANEVDDMIFDLDTFDSFSLLFYEFAEKHAHPSEVKMEQIRSRLGTDREFTGLDFTHETSDLNYGPLCSSYKILPTMQEKVNSMMVLCMKIRAVDVNDVSRLVIERHFIRDIRGNLRKFSQQEFRCVSCNEKFRRPPLVGKCTHCGGRIIFTISEGSILKYMQPALELARKYKVPPYLLESLELTEMYIQSIFGKERERQEGLGKWF